MSNGTPVNLPFSILSEWTDHFDIEIGKGAFGSVFKGTVVLDGQHPQQEIQVAVKKVNAEGICASLLVDGVEGGRGGRAFIQAIQREINVLSAFHHPNIIRLIGYCLPPIEEVRASEQRMKELCLVYELAPLGGLNAVLKNDELASQLTWKDRLDVAIGISRGLSCLHNVVPGCPAFHRDVKAANVALMADFTPKIIDCGLSKYVPDGGTVGMSNLSSMGTRFGTPGYICSNYTRKPVPYDAKCEVFSFGVVLLELFTGLLQNYVDESGQPILLEETLEDDGTLTADVRAGEWPEECQEEYLQLARECTARYSKRIDKMMDVMQRLVAIRNKHIVPTSFEASLLAKNQALIAQVEALQLHNEIKDRGEREFKCECCFDDKVGVSKGVLCSNTDNPHFICGSANTDCFSAMVTAQANDNVAFKKNGSYIICAYCTALDHDIVTPFGSAQVTKHANGPALSAFKRAVSDAVFTAPVCVLCLDNPKEIILLPCFHKTYCVTCFKDPSVKNQRDCPYCRKRITGSGRVFE
jgi:serine/threonine protein kinase